MGRRLKVEGGGRKVGVWRWKVVRKWREENRRRKVGGRKLLKRSKVKREAERESMKVEVGAEVEGGKCNVKGGR